MQVVQSYPDGMFNWVDLASTDADSAKSFYSELFGWSFEDKPIDGGGVYTMATLHGYHVAGLSQHTPEMMEQGIPSVWSSYISHSDVDSVVSKATSAGGSLMIPPMQVMEEGRMAIIQDPSGAMVGVWQAQKHIGAQLVNIPNTLVWNELQTKDGDAAKAFYKEVFGWGDDSDPNGYVTYSINSRTQAGMIVLDDTYPVPPNWTTYFLVEDVAAVTAKVKDLGGQAFMENNPAGELGIFSAVADPQGAAFVIMQFNGPVDAPPGY
ncbi:MAG: VOC family protein [Chloroflexota bacterium]